MLWRLNVAGGQPGTDGCMDNSSTTPDDVERVAVAGLHRRHHVRRALNVDHVERLAEVLSRCPPILIGADGTLVDGQHRVAAARQLGIDELPALRLPPSDTYGAELIRAIEANTCHGLPLTRQERRDSITAVLGLRSELSDREIARICGVSRSVVATIRSTDARSGGSSDHVNGRVGGDGKRYGSAPTRWRAHLEALVRIDPSTGVRSLAERTGASVGAVQARRRNVLEQLDAEPRMVRWWRRLRARWTLRRLGYAPPVNRRAAA